MDGIDNSVFERPGKVKVVTGEAEDERDGIGSWGLVQAQQRPGKER